MVPRCREDAMPVLFHLTVTAVDFLGYHARHEMTVIAADEEELREEIDNFFALRDVTDSWKISEIIERRQLADADPHSLTYRDRGPHSYR
jgi:hypothetical protein